jgi:hypothetical protein
MRANRIDRGEKIHAGEEKEEGGGEKEKEASVSRHRSREHALFLSRMHARVPRRATCTP